MIKIVTDSTAYLSTAQCQAHDIHLVPLCVHFGEQGFKEGVDLGVSEFYERLQQAPELPTTSQPSAGEFYEVFEPLVDDGHEILVLTISSKLSGTWNSAMAAKEMLPDAPITVIDSLSTAMGLQLMLEAAISAVEQGATRQDVKALIKEIQSKISVMFVVDTLEYLAKGGRIGNAKAFLGTLLKIKPILYLHEGAIEPLEQVRSKRKALARMRELAQEQVGDKGAQAHIALTHALVPNEAQAFKQDLMSCLGCPEPSVTEIGPVIGTHTGPGVIGMAVYV